VQDYAIYMLDPKERSRAGTPAASASPGYAADEVVGRHFEMFHRPDDLRAGEPGEEMRVALMYRRAHRSGWRLRKDGTRFWADIVTTPLRDHHGELRGYAQVMRDLSERKRMEELEEQGRRVNEFLAMLAHELRNPLAPIRNALAILSVSRETRRRSPGAAR
jgi:PAS domain S-box-containing protein